MNNCNEVTFDNIDNNQNTSASSLRNPRESARKKEVSPMTKNHPILFAYNY